MPDDYYGPKFWSDVRARAERIKSLLPVMAAPFDDIVIIYDSHPEEEWPFSEVRVTDLGAIIMSFLVPVTITPTETGLRMNVHNSTGLPGALRVIPGGPDAAPPAAPSPHPSGPSIPR